jgi:hypothetical protein
VSGLQFYGFSTGLVCKTSTGTTATTGTYTINSGFGVSGISNGTYLASLFEVGDGVAIATGGTLTSNAIGTVSAKATTPTLTIVWGGSVVSVNNDEIVFANAVTDATVSATDYGRWPSGSPRRYHLDVGDGSVVFDGTQLGCCDQQLVWWPILLRVAEEGASGDHELV